MSGLNGNAFAFYSCLTEQANGQVFYRAQLRELIEIVSFLCSPILIP